MGPLLFLSLAGVTVDSSGEIRLLDSAPPDFAVDAEGTMLGQDETLDLRVRVREDLKANVWSLGAEADLYTGTIDGDPWDLPDTVDARNRDQVGGWDADNFVPRRFAIDGRIAFLGVSAGLQPSHWGLGLVANDGAHDPEFGRSDFGDRVLRLRLGTRPFGGGTVPLTVAVAADRVVADDIATMAEEQEAWQGVFATLWAPPNEPTRGGLYAVYRHQVEADDERKTNAIVLDLYGEHAVESGGWALSGGAEVAGIAGRTSRSRSYTSPEGLDVRSAGAVGYLGLGQSDGGGGLRLRGGWASGDGNPDDGVTHDFTMDRDLDVGMVLFDEYQAAIEANTWAILSDPEYAGQAPDGAEALVTEGAVKKAAFVQPILERTFLPWLGVKTGVLFAWSTGPIAHPFYTARNGGTPTNHLGEETTGYRLGTEIDWAMKVGQEVRFGSGLAGEAPKGGITPEVLVQGGHLLPSVDFGGSETGWLSMYTVTGRLRW